MVEYFPVTGSDVSDLCDNLRECDLIEIRNSSMHPPADAIRLSVMASEFAAAAYIDGKILCIYGLHKFSDGYSPWCIGSNEMLKKKHKRSIITGAREILAEMRQFGFLSNYVQSDNYPAIKLLKILGFTLGEQVDKYNNGINFTYFHLEP